jgi:ABC-2 type transport system permease protein
MKDFKTLKILDVFSGVFERFDINYPLMRRILAMKLTMDGRKIPTIFNQQAKKKNKPAEENGFMKSLWMYALLGIMLIPVVAFGDNYFFQMSIFFGIVMFLVMTSMISDFSTVLLDLRDKGILLTKPVDKRTINAAKTIHICIYLIFLTGALTAVPLVVGTIEHGVLFLILTVLELFLLDLFIVVLTALIYFYILRFFDGEKLKDIINYVQIGLSISIIIGYQILARSFSLIELDIVFNGSWWQFIIPPIWFGATFELLLHKNINNYLIGFSTLAFLVPILSFIVYNKMMPAFERNIQKLANHSGKSKRVERKWKNHVADYLCRTQEEKSFFRFADNMMRNEREFRLKVYPSLGISLVLPFVFLFNEMQFSSYTQLASSKWYLSVYMCNLIIPGSVNMLKYSGKYKGAWIFKTMPIQSISSLFSATLKVFLVNLYLPIYFLLSVVYMGIFGVDIIPDLLIVFVTSILYTIICSSTLKDSLPFSESFEEIQTTNLLKMILAFLIIAVFVGIHYWITFISYGVFVYLIILSVGTILVWKQARKLWWSNK